MKIFQDCIFFIITLFHIFIWVFVLLAFINKKAAYYNIFFVIPAIYIIHCLPFHIIGELKKNIYPYIWEKITENINNILFFPMLKDKLEKFFSKSFANPLSPQGMLILGFILSTSRFKYNILHNLQYNILCFLF